MNAKEVVNNYIKEVNAWLQDNMLTDLPEYSKLRDKDTLGRLYRSDQIYFETISRYRANLYSLKSYYLKQRTEESVRTQNKFETMVDLITNEIYMINNYAEAAKNRIKFYENIMYMISNMTYGDF